MLRLTIFSHVRNRIVLKEIDVKGLSMIIWELNKKKLIDKNPTRVLK